MLQLQFSLRCVPLHIFFRNSLSNNLSGESSERTNTTVAIEDTYLTNYTEDVTSRDKIYAMLLMCAAFKVAMSSKLKIAFQTIEGMR